MYKFHCVRDPITVALVLLEETTFRTFIEKNKNTTYSIFTAVTLD